MNHEISRRRVGNIFHVVADYVELFKGKVFVGKIFLPRGTPQHEIIQANYFLDIELFAEAAEKIRQVKTDKTRAARD